jgi:CHASE2 domain-containing sensor protein/signal transduction histidine kinase
MHRPHGPYPLLEQVALSVLLVAGGLFLVNGEWMWRWDHLLYDAQLKLWSRPAPADIVIVAVDEASLSALGRWPWPRRVHAELVARLAEEGARAVGLDILFAEPDGLDPAGDQMLAAALDRSERSVLPVFVEQPRLGGQLIETLPIPAIAQAAAALGHVHAELDPDGIARSVYLLEGLGQARWPTLSLAMLRLVNPQGWGTLPGLRKPLEQEDISQVWVRDHHILVPFAGPPGHFPRVSFASVLAGDYPAGIFRNAHVLIGVTATGLGDALPTPVSGRNQPMPGVEFNANVLEALRSGNVIEPLALRWRLMVTGLIVLLPMLLFPRLAPRSSLVVAGILLVGTLGACAVVLRTTGWWFPPATALLGVAVSYPLWSWRRLEFAMRYLNRELALLQREQAELPAGREASLSSAMGFLSELMPVRGWTLIGARGEPAARWGQVPESVQPWGATNDWKRVGPFLWTSLPDVESEWQLGVTWDRDDAPTPAEQRLLTEVAYPFTRADSRPPFGTVEVVQARIQQVQSATNRLRAMRRFVAGSLAQMADGVVVVGASGQVQLANRQAARYLSGDPHEELTGKPVLELLGPVELQDTVTWPRALARVLLEHQSLQVNARHREGWDLLVQLAPLVRSADRPGHMVINLSDISALRSSERKRSELLGFISHDLRSPIVSVLALLELAKEKPKATEILPLLSRMEAYAGKTLELAEQFLHLARVERTEAVRFDDVDLCAVALNAFEQTWAQAGAKKIELVRDIGVEPLWVRGESGLLERAIVNLLTNAIRYSAEGTRVKLRVDCVDDSARCCVVDQGYGIHHEDFPYLFDRFQRARRGKHLHVEGTGLGLAFVQAVAERHGGRVDVESELGEGSRFCLVLNALTETPGCH